MNWLFGSLITCFLFGTCRGQVPHLLESTKEAWKTQECLKVVKPEMKRLIDYSIEERLSKIEELAAQLESLKIFLTENTFVGCPKGWSFFDFKCYLFSADQQDWNTAKTTCKAKEGYLVEINNKNENEFLKSVARSHGVMFWIGASDQISEGNWTWEETGRDVMSGFVDWTSRQPDNSRGNQDCAVLWRAGNFSWDDQQCLTKQRFICEQRAAWTGTIAKKHRTISSN